MTYHQRRLFDTDDIRDEDTRDRFDRNYSTEAPAREGIPTDPGVVFDYFLYNLVSSCKTIKYGDRFFSASGARKKIEVGDEKYFEVDFRIVSNMIPTHYRGNQVMLQTNSFGDYGKITSYTVCCELDGACKTFYAEDYDTEFQLSTAICKYLKEKFVDCIDYFRSDEEASLSHAGHMMPRQARDLHAIIGALHKRILALEQSKV
jgi:hypothetical protein